MAEYALYKGDELLGIGTAKELAKMHGVKEKTIYFYTSPVYKKRCAARPQNKGNFFDGGAFR